MLLETEVESPLLLSIFIGYEFQISLQLRYMNPPCHVLLGLFTQIHSLNEDYIIDEVFFIHSKAYFSSMRFCLSEVLK